MGNLDALQLIFGGRLVRPCRRAGKREQREQRNAETGGREAYVNLMLGVFLGGGKKSSWFLWETEKSRLDDGVQGLAAA